MREIRLKPPVLALIGATRGLLGIGIGLLLAGKFSRNRRAAVGWTLAAIGAASTIPLAMRVFRGQRSAEPNGFAKRDAAPAYPS